MKILVWYENNPHGGASQKEKEIYPNGIHGALKELFETQEDMEVRTAVMQDEDQGLSDDNLNWADVMVYWSHGHWPEIRDDRALAAKNRVLDGMGLILLHSAHTSKIFSSLMGTRTQILRWREGSLTNRQKQQDPTQPYEEGEWQRVWLVNPSHPIAKGLTKEFFTIPKDETYGEYFEIPQPEAQVFITSSEGGEIFRSGNCWHRGMGKIFYFSAGHETFPVYYQKEIRQVLLNAVRWAAPDTERPEWPDWAREAERETR